MELDYSLYPELDPQEWPRHPLSLDQQIDYLQRLCSSWDFYGFPPDLATLKALAGWREAFLAGPLLHSPAYLGLCCYLGFPHGSPQPYLGQLLWEQADQLEGRPPDPCLEWA